MEHVLEKLGMTYAAELLIISQTHSEKTLDFTKEHNSLLLKQQKVTKHMLVTYKNC